jgi:hypothetical protein
MLRSIVAEIVHAPLAQHKAVVAEKACLPDIAIFRPARRAKCGDPLDCLARQSEPRTAARKPKAPVAPASMPAFEKTCGA